MKFVIDGMFVILFGISLAGMGAYFFKRILKTEIDFFTGFFAGCGLAIVFLFFCGILSLFFRNLFLAYIIFVFIFAIPGRRLLFRHRLAVDKKLIVPFLLLAIVLFVAGLAALSPPIKNDTLFYHLGLPKLWAGDGGIEFYSTIPLSASALNSELLLTPILAFVSPEAAQFFVFLVGIMVCGAAGRAYSKLTAGQPLTAILALGTVPLFVSGLCDAKNDYLAVGFALIAFIKYFEYMESGRFREILFAGIFAGLAASTKPNALIFVVGLSIMLAIERRNLKAVAGFLAAAVIFGSPWYIRAFIETGNPFFPFFDNLFHSDHWRPLFDDFNAATFVASERRNILNFITSPFRLIFLPDIFRGRLGPLPLALLPLLLIFRPVPKTLRITLWLSAIFFVIWYMIWPNARYLLPIVPVLCLVTAYILERLTDSGRALRLSMIAIITVLIALTGLQIVRDGIGRIKAATGLVSRDEFLKSAMLLDPNRPMSAAKLAAIPYYDIWAYLNLTAPEDAVVGILCSNWNRADGFYLERRYRYLNPTEQATVDFAGNKGQIALALVRNNVQYVLIDKTVVREFAENSPFSNAPGFSVFSSGVRDFLEVVRQNGRLILITDRFELHDMKGLTLILEGPFS